MRYLISLVLVAALLMGVTVMMGDEDSAGPRENRDELTVGLQSGGLPPPACLPPEWPKCPPAGGQ